ncbi:MAG: sigma-54 dependent transcriptional regulator [Bryobacteraceae bacterium]|jgi:DNA-binding NtrC family response regulator
MNRSAPPPAYGLVGRSPEIDAVRRLIEKASRNRLPVLLLGESGTGKEVVARAIYNANPRGQFVPIDCGSLVGTLVESDLFGHAKGAFSGAVENKKGLVEVAAGGTAFFDEIGDLPLEMQVKLLRLLQEREFRAVGALEWRKIDLRFIAATHRTLRAEVAAGRFREDLFYRLNVFIIHLPPLRDRKEDIPLLVEHFLNGDGFSPSPEILSALQSYDWPGNVRELKHCLDRIAALQSEGVVQTADMPSALQCHLAASSLRQLSSAIGSGYGAGPAAELPQISLAPKSPVISLPESERQAISSALAATNGDRTRAARLLSIGRTTLYRKMKEYGFD